MNRLCLLLLLLAGLSSGDAQTLPTEAPGHASALVRQPAPRDFDMRRLMHSQRPLEAIAAAATRHGVTFGIWGGTVRDLYLGLPFTVISDYDLIYDSSQPGFAAFRDEVLALPAKFPGRIPLPDFHMDLNPAKAKSDRQQQLHGEGITATKVGLFSDGTLFDPTGKGVADLRARIFRFHAPSRRDRIEIHNLGRFVRDSVRLHEFQTERETEELFRRSFEMQSRSGSPDLLRLRAAVALCRQLPGVSGGPVTFRALIRPFRKDLRYLHDQQLEKLTPYFPMDLFLFELFKTVTQAPDVAAMRRIFASLGVDRFLGDVGFDREAAILMDATLSRDALFDRFHFPGHVPKRRLGFPEEWEQTLRRYNYRVLFDMLASEFASDSKESVRLRECRDRFLSPGSYATLDPGDEYGEELLGFLDTDFNNGKLPRDRVQRSLRWFLEKYLPLGNTTLAPLESRGTRAVEDRKLSLPPLSWPPSRGALAASLTLEDELRRGFSLEVAAIDRDAGHSMRDLGGYLDLQVGRELVGLYLDPRTRLAFVMGDEDRAVGLLRADGYSKFLRVNAAGFSRRRRTMLGIDGERVCVAAYGIHTEEQLLNEQARFWMLGESGRRIDGSNVVVLRSRDPEDFPDRQALGRYLDRLGQPPDLFVFGFTQPLKQILTRARSTTVGDLELVAGTLPGTSRIALGLSGFGASYGSLPARIARCLIRRGTRAFAFLGTAGGLGRGGARTRWTAPDRVQLVDTQGYRRGGTLQLHNLTERFVLPGLRRGGLHATVATPLSETRAMVGTLEAAGATSVDCELAYLARAITDLSGSGSLVALLNLTDHPASASGPTADQGAIELSNPAEQRRTARSILTQIVLDLSRPRVRNARRDSGTGVATSTSGVRRRFPTYRATPVSPSTGGASRSPR